MEAGRPSVVSQLTIAIRPPDSECSLEIRVPDMSHTSLKQEYVRLRMELAHNPDPVRRVEMEARCRRILWILGRRYDWPTTRASRRGSSRAIR